MLLFSPCTKVSFSYGALLIVPIHFRYTFVEFTFTPYQTEHVNEVT